MASKNYTLKPVSTPAKPRRDAPSNQAVRKDERAADIQIRAENEDDDGYDPYSDRTEPHPLFEKDPWD